MEQITEESSSYERSFEIIPPVKEKQARTQSFHSSKLSTSIKLKKLTPKRSASSPTVRIEVRLQRPLTWQVSSSSSSSITIPRKSSKWSTIENHLTEDGEICVENGKIYTDDPLNGGPSRRKIRNRRVAVRRLLKDAQDRNYDGSSTDEDEIPEPCTSESSLSKGFRRRKRVGGKVKSPTEFCIPAPPNFADDVDVRPAAGNRSGNCSLVPILKLSLGGRSGRSSRSSREEVTQSLLPDSDFPIGECDAHPVMTWFRNSQDTHLNVNNKDKEMGANGSTQCQGQSSGHLRHGHAHGHGHCLKSRSHSSSALYTNKTGLAGSMGVNNVVVGSTPYIPASNGYGHMNGHDNKGLSNSIPADLWDLPPNSKSCSPVRLRSQMAQHAAAQQSENVAVGAKYMKQGQGHQRIPAEVSMTRGKKGGGRKGSGGGKARVEQHNISNRAKLYAVSCPDVAQGSTTPGIVQRTCPENPHPHHNNHYREVHLPHCAKYQGGRRQKSFEGPTTTTNSVDISNAKCSYPYPAYPFISTDSIFEVLLKRDQLGLGLSVTGGSDSQEKYPGLIRIKKVFPMGPAFQSGRLHAWDIILKANGVPLTGLNNHEALEVLRTTPPETLLTLCRPPANIPGFHESANLHSSQPAMLNSSHNLGTQPGLNCGTSGSDMGPCREEQDLSFKSKSLSSLKIPQTHPALTYGEFEVTLEKYAGSLGFTLRQEDTSVLGHYVRALVKDPALTDGRIQPGDRILSVNDVDLMEMTHGEAITFLRQCQGKVKLRLYRDAAPTPISPLSPTESIKGKPKPFRQEALDMLNDLAIRKKLSGSSDGNAKSSPGSAVSRFKGGRSVGTLNDAIGPATLPRQRRPAHAAHVPSPEVLSAALDRFAGQPTTPKSSKSQSPCSGIGNNTGESGLGSSTSYPSETRSSGSGESTPAGTISQCRSRTDPRLGHGNSHFRSRPNLDFDVGGHPLDSSTASSDLNLSLDTPVRNPKKKTSFRQYTLHLDRISSLEDESFSTDLNHSNSLLSEPGFGPSSNSHDDQDGSKFSRGLPTYQSAIIPSNRGKASKTRNLSLSRDDMVKYGQGQKDSNSSGTMMPDTDTPSSNTNKSEVSPPKASPRKCNQQSNQLNGISAGNPVNHTHSSSSSASSTCTGKVDGLVKWKGIQFPQDDEDDVEDNLDSLDERHTLPKGQPLGCNGGLGVPARDSHLPPRRSPDGRECEPTTSSNLIEVPNSKDEQILTVQLSRRWCSRLGFSLGGTNGHISITAVYPDSVAGRDGRLRVGDEVIMVNNETVRGMDTPEVIDLMRKARGMIDITLLRKPTTTENSGTEPPNSNGLM